MTNAITEGANPEEEGVEEIPENPETPETPEVPEKPEKAKRTPQEELEYFEGRAARIRKKLGVDSEPKPVEKTVPAQKSGDLDYGQKAFLRSYDIKGADELTLVKAEVKRSGLELDDLVENEYFQGKLKNLRDARAVADAVPKGTKRSNQAGGDDLQVALSNYNDSGKLPDDSKLREKVLDAALEHQRGAYFGQK